LRLFYKNISPLQIAILLTDPNLQVTGDLVRDKKIRDMKDQLGLLLWNYTYRLSEHMKVPVAELDKSTTEGQSMLNYMAQFVKAEGKNLTGREQILACHLLPILVQNRMISQELALEYSKLVTKKNAKQILGSDSISKVTRALQLYEAHKNDAVEEVAANKRRPLLKDSFVKRLWNDIYDDITGFTKLHEASSRGLALVGWGYVMNLVRWFMEFRKQSPNIRLRHVINRGLRTMFRGLMPVWLVMEAGLYIEGKILSQGSTIGYLPPFLMFARVFSSLYTVGLALRNHPFILFPFVLSSTWSSVDNYLFLPRSGYGFINKVLDEDNPFKEPNKKE